LHSSQHPEINYEQTMNPRQPDSQRRAFLKGTAALPLLWAVDGSLRHIRAQSAGSEQVLPGLRLLRNSVNSALLERNGKTLLIDSGELDAAGRGIVDWALFTHHHRDQCSSVSRLVRKGTKVAVPFREKMFFDEAHRFWDSADNIIDHRYDFRPHLFTLRDSVPVARALQAGDVHEWEGLRFQVLDTPGHTDGSVTYLVEVAGRRVAFTGDLIAALDRSGKSTVCKSASQECAVTIGDLEERLKN
jgi:glyoxylase-like metal-dependent hydrolase (beta-lactamase superfamily II)